MSIEALPPQDGVRVVQAHGEVDFASSERLLPQLRALAADAAGVLLDLSDVTFFDSAGVRLIDRLARSCARGGTAFCVVAPTDGVPRRVLELVGLARTSTAPDVESGLALLRARARPDRAEPGPTVDG